MKKEQKFAEVTIGQLYMKIPNEPAQIEQAIEFLRAFHHRETPKPIPAKKEENKEEPKQEVEEQKVVYLSSGEGFTICPICKGKLKRKGIKQQGEFFTQRIFCKNRKCNFSREYQITL